MATSTSKLGLTKPAGTDPVDIAVLNSNADKIDAAVGTVVCTSTTRPALPYNGLQIYETDTDKLLTYASGAWEATVNQTVTKSFSVYTVANQAARDALFPSPVQGNAVWRNDKGYLERYYTAYNASTNPGGQTPAGWYSSERNTGLVALAAPTISTNQAAAVANTSNTVTFSGATSISLNNVFSSSYTNYRVYINLSTNSASASLYYRYRVSGADNTTANYWFGGFFSRTSGAAPGGYSSGGAGATAATLLWVNGAAYGGSSAVMDIASPNTGTRTIAITNGHGHDATSAMMIGTTSYFNAATAFDGITFYSSSGTISGSVIVYGYNN